MSLKIAGKSFRVTDAVLGGSLHHKSWKKFDPTIGSGVQYSLTVKCEPKTFTLDGRQREWQPSLEIGRFSIDAAMWPEIAHQTVKNVEGSGFLDGHESVIATSLAFGKRTGRRFALTMKGQCGGIDFAFEGPVDFDGVRVVGTFRDTEDSLTAMLAKHLDPSGLVAEESTVNEWIPRKKMRSKNFLPARRL